jgi:RNA polymerase sigma-54 factor
VAVETDEIQAVVHQIQNFDPAGVAARDLSECLQLQLRILEADTPGLAHACQLATPEYLDLLGARDFRQLKRVLKLSPEDLQQAIALVQHLNPRPGASVATSHAGYVIPDITVKKIRGVWRAELTASAMPRVTINRDYEKLIRRGNDSADNKYLQDKLQEARWFIKSLNSRNETLLKVARAIVDRRARFSIMTRGGNRGPTTSPEPVGTHESTISTRPQQVHADPRGIFELKCSSNTCLPTAHLLHHPLADQETGRGREIQQADQ